ncbi:hypothetical protein FGB62_164g02 [Gracilaria domingensis]|nr:hypothetical protein FGB62_164g02 [Gracilaria domingensis]
MLAASRRHHGRCHVRRAAGAPAADAAAARHNGPRPHTEGETVDWRRASAIARAPAPHQCTRVRTGLAPAQDRPPVLHAAGGAVSNCACVLRRSFSGPNVCSHYARRVKRGRIQMVGLRQSAAGEVRPPRHPLAVVDDATRGVPLWASLLETKAFGRENDVEKNNDGSVISESVVPAKHLFDSGVLKSNIDYDNCWSAASRAARKKCRAQLRIYLAHLKEFDADRIPGLPILERVDSNKKEDLCNGEKGGIKRAQWPHWAKGVRRLHKDLKSYASSQNFAETFVSCNGEHVLGVLILSSSRD